jgi:hypothetical protein
MLGYIQKWARLEAKIGAGYSGRLAARIKGQIDRRSGSNNTNEAEEEEEEGEGEGSKH